MAHPAAEWYYAVKNYTGTSEEQLSVIAGEPLHLLDDSDNEWWYAISPRTEQAGYIPALFVESTQSRIARVNAVKNKKLLLPNPEDLNSTTQASHQKKLNFAAEPIVYVFEDESEENMIARKDSEDLFASYGLIRVYAGIWDLEVTYKAIKVGPNTNTEEVIRTAVAKFMQVKNPEAAANPASISQAILDSYSLYVVIGSEERKFMPDEFPLKEFEKMGLDDEQRKIAKFQLKKTVGEIEGIPIRIYSEENLFKTIIVSPPSTVSEVIKSAVTKFRIGRPEAFTLRMVVAGKERFLEGEDKLYEIIQANKQEGVDSTQKFFLFRRRVSVDNTADQGVLRVYGGNLDLDVAYRSMFVDATSTAEAVVQMTLEKYNSRDSPKDYQLNVTVSGEHERMLDKNEKPLLVLRTLTAANPEGHVKFSLKKASNAQKPNQQTIKMTKLPMRIYCDFITKGGAPTFKPVLVSENMTAASVVFLAIEKFNIKSNLTIQDYSLYFLNDETGIKRLLLPDELPLLVKNELSKKATCHLSKQSGVLADSVAVHVHASRVWPGETVGKTILVSKTSTTALEAITLALEKYKYKGVDASMFRLIKVNPDLNDAPNAKPFEDNDFPFSKEKWEDYALVKRENQLDIPTMKMEEKPGKDYFEDPEINTTAEDVRKLLSTDSLLNVADDTIGDVVDVGDLDTAYSKLSENLSHLIQIYGQ